MPGMFLGLRWLEKPRLDLSLQMLRLILLKWALPQMHGLFLGEQIVRTPKRKTLELILGREGLNVTFHLWPTDFSLIIKIASRRSLWFWWYCSQRLHLKKFAETLLVHILVQTCYRLLAPSVVVGLVLKNIGKLSLNFLFRAAVVYILFESLTHSLALILAQNLRVQQIRVLKRYPRL